MEYKPRPMSKTIARTLDEFEQNPRIIDNEPAFLAVHIERVGNSGIRVSHYVNQAGDTVPDPSIEFVKVDDRWFPVSGETITGYRTTALELAGGQIIAVYPRPYLDLRKFARIFLTNIQYQQGV